MSATVLERPVVAVPAKKVDPIPFTRVLGVELRKMFDTRSGFWLLAGIGLTSLVATIAVVAFATDDALTYETFASAVGIPASIILPIIAVLAVTSEWSQRAGLTTFTLVPHRGRVILAKLICALGVGVVAIPVAMAIGAVGNVVGPAIAGVDPVWNVSVAEASRIVLANALGLMMGFVLGVLIRSSAGAVVGYFVYALVLPGILATLAAFQEWFRDLQPWVDFRFSSMMLFEDRALSGEQWAQIGLSAIPWVLVPLAVGLWLVRRTEVK